MNNHIHSCGGKIQSIPSLDEDGGFNGYTYKCKQCQQEVGINEYIQSEEGYKMIEWPKAGELV